MQIVVNRPYVYNGKGHQHFFFLRGVGFVHPKCLRCGKLHAGETKSRSNDTGACYFSLLGILRIYFRCPIVGYLFHQPTILQDEIEKLPEAKFDKLAWSTLTAVGMDLANHFPNPAKNDVWQLAKKKVQKRKRLRHIDDKIKLRPYQVDAKLREVKVGNVRARA